MFNHVCTEQIPNSVITQIRHRRTQERESMGVNVADERTRLIESGLPGRLFSTILKEIEVVGGVEAWFKL